MDLPDQAARREILSLMLRDETLATDVVLDALAAMTANYSGSDLKNLCMAAALNAVRRSAAAAMAPGGGAARTDWSRVPVHRSVAWADFLRAFDEVRRTSERDEGSDGEETKGRTSGEPSGAQAAQY